MNAPISPAASVHSSHAGSPVVLVLAAGRGERFAASGGQVHKLAALLCGKPVLTHVLDAVRASGLPHHLVQADASRPGMGDSIAAGVRATADADGWLVLPGDLPLIQPQSLRQLAAALKTHAVVVPVHQGQRGHPVGFSSACGPQLQSLFGPQGAASVVRAQGATDIAVDDVGTITDVDTLDDLQRAQALMLARA